MDQKPAVYQQKAIQLGSQIRISLPKMPGALPAKKSIKGTYA